MAAGPAAEVVHSVDDRHPQEQGLKPDRAGASVAEKLASTTVIHKNKD